MAAVEWALTEQQKKIADAVIHVIATQGFDVVSVRTVAKECGITAGSVQYHYATRQDLLTAALIHSLDRQRDQLLTPIGSRSYFEFLLDILSRLLPLQGQLLEDATAWVSFVSASGTRPWLADIVSDAIQRLQTFIEEVLVHAEMAGELAAWCTPAQGARLLSILVSGITLDVLAVPSIADRALDDLVAGLGLIVPST